MGDRIKIPKIEGLPFKRPPEKVEAHNETVEKTVQLTQQENQSPADSVPSIQTSTTSPLEPLEPNSLANMAAANDNENIIAYREAGIKLYNEGRFEDAIFELNKSIEALPHDEKTRIYLAS